MLSGFKPDSIFVSYSLCAAGSSGETAGASVTGGSVGSTTGGAVGGSVG